MKRRFALLSATFAVLGAGEIVFAIVDPSIPNRIMGGLWLCMAVVQLAAGCSDARHVARGNNDRS